MANASSWKPQWQHRYCQECSISESCCICSKTKSHQILEQLLNWPILFIYPANLGKPWESLEKPEPVHMCTTGKNAFDRLMATARRLQWEEQQSAQPHLPVPHDTSSTTIITQKDGPCTITYLITSWQKTTCSSKTSRLLSQMVPWCFMEYSQTPCMIWSIIGLPKCPAFLSISHRVVAF